MTRTVVATAYGGPEGLAVQDIELPALEPGQVLIDVRAAGTNPFDYKSYSGAFGNDPAKLPLPLGFEVSGVIAAVEQRGHGFNGSLGVGDAVLAGGDPAEVLVASRRERSTDGV